MEKIVKSNGGTLCDSMGDAMRFKLIGLDADGSHTARTTAKDGQMETSNGASS